MVPNNGDPLGRIIDGALAARQGRVVWIGQDGELEAKVELDGDQLDAAGACVIPGLVDAHTHPVFAGSRADEFAERVSGGDYRAQQSGERGIASTVRATREADPASLLALTEARANRFLANGTTTIEAKTGYGLDLPNEAKSFDVLRQLAARTPLRIIPTFLGAHVVSASPDRGDVARLQGTGRLLRRLVRRASVHAVGNAGDPWASESPWIPAAHPCSATGARRGAADCGRAWRPQRRPPGICHAGAAQGAGQRGDGRGA